MDQTVRDRRTSDGIRIREMDLGIRRGGRVSMMEIRPFVSPSPPRDSSP